MATVPSIGRAGFEARFEPEAEATRALYERYANQVYGYCLHQLGSREEAEDAVQSTFLNAFRGLRRGVVPEIEQAWLFKIAQNVCLSRRRSSWRRGRIESPSAFEFAEETAPAPHRRADELIGLQDVLEHMPENQRRAILLREWQGLSYREIAEELELSQAAVETLIFRARRSLAQGLEASPAEQRSWRQKVRPSAAIGNLLSPLKSLLASGLAVKAAGTAAVVAVTSVTVGPPVVRELSMPHRSVAHQHAASAASPTSAVAPPSSSAAVVSSGTLPVPGPKRHAAKHPRHAFADSLALATRGADAVTGAAVVDPPTLAPAPADPAPVDPAAAQPPAPAPAPVVASAAPTSAPAPPAPAPPSNGGASPSPGSQSGKTTHDGDPTGTKTAPAPPSAPSPPTTNGTHAVPSEPLRRQPSPPPALPTVTQQGRWGRSHDAPSDPSHGAGQWPWGLGPAGASQTAPPQPPSGQVDASSGTGSQASPTQGGAPPQPTGQQQTAPPAPTPPSAGNPPAQQQPPAWTPPAAPPAPMPPPAFTPPSHDAGNGWGFGRHH